MSLHTHITDLITAYKAMPNSERRNKIVSHLKDAEAHAKLLEIEDSRFKSEAEEQSLFNSSQLAYPVDETPCICQPGMRDKTCRARAHVA